MINQSLHDRYQIQASLGRKTGRRTFLATDLETDSPVVIKLMLFSHDFVWDDLKLFEREAETLKSIDHPAIPNYLDFFEIETESGKGFALVQSYIEARSLQEWVQAGCTFSEDELKTIATALLNILEYLHTRQPPVIHRDIKPSNVLLRNRSGNSPGEVYLVDFGSVQTAAHGGTMTVVGTYGYMPPEQFGGRSLPASDLYGLGATLIYLATGQHPADLPHNDLKVEFKQLTTLSQSFTDWLEWLTDPSLVKRPASTQDAIQHFLKPRQLQKKSPKQSLRLGVRPLSSYISLEATPTTLELKVPSNQIQYIFPGMHSPCVWGCLIPLLMTFFLTALLQAWVMLAVAFYFLGYSIYTSRLKREIKLGHTFLNAISLNNNTGNRLRCADITFQLDGSSVIATLSLVQNEQPIVIFKGNLQAISAGLETTPQYRLNLNFQAISDTIIVSGNRHEIQWLCDELSEWTGIEVQHWQAPSA